MAIRLPSDVVKSRIKRVTRQLSKNGFKDVDILSIEQVNRMLTMAEKNDDSHIDVSNIIKGIINEDGLRNLKLAETIYLQVKFVEKSKPKKLRIVKLTSFFQFKEIIQ